MKKIFGLLVATAMVSIIFAGVVAAGESNFVYGTTNVDGAKLISWVPSRSDEILSDETGAAGNYGGPGGFAYDIGNHFTGWASPVQTRAMICTAAGETISVEGTAITATGVTDMGGPIDPVAMSVPTATPNGAVMDLAWADPGDPLIWGYLVYRSDNGGGSGYTLISGTTTTGLAGRWASNLVANLERSTAVNAGLTYTDNTGTPGESYEYAIRYVYAGQVLGVDEGIPTQIHDGTLGMPTGYTPVYSAYGNLAVYGVVANNAPTVTDTQVSLVGNLLAGDHNDETMTFQVQVTDTIEGDFVTAADINVNGEGWTGMTIVGVSDNAVEEFTYLYTAPAGLYPEGVPVGYDVRGYDTEGGPGATASDTFTINDVVNPDVIYGALTPIDAAEKTIGSGIDIYAEYTDFTNFTLATLSYWNTNEGEIDGDHVIAMTDYAWTDGSIIVDFVGSFVSYGTAGDIIDYYVTVQDGAGNPVVSSIPQTITVTAAAANEVAPTVLYGIAQQYNGVAGVYTPLPIAGATVTCSYYNTSSAAQEVMTYTADGAGQYVFDIHNSTDGDFVYVNVTANPVYTNLGWNYSLITVVSGEVDPFWQNVTCGIPYDILITAPLPAANIVVGALFDLNYQVVDMLGDICEGYYTVLAPGNGVFNMTAGPIIPAVNSYTAPADQTFNGVADGGVYVGVAVMQINFPLGQWYLNESEGGQIDLDTLYLTPWGAIFQDPLNTVPLFLKDWDNITINVVGGGFDWYLTTGWNLVSCPQDGTFRAAPNLLNPNFDSQDALNWTNQYLFTTNGVYDHTLSMAQRTGTGAYDVYALDNGEGGLNFNIDTTAGYWVYYGGAAATAVNFMSLNATTTGINTQDVAVSAGWNLLGYQHNDTGAIGWGAYPLASQWAAGVIDTSGYMAGLTKIVVTTWSTSKWYKSYVVDAGFLGMPAQDWQWMPVIYSTNPGDGFWLWVDAGGTMTYSTIA